MRRSDWGLRIVDCGLQSAGLRLIGVVLLALPVLLSAAGRMAVMNRESAQPADTLDLAGRLQPHMSVGGVVLAVLFAGTVVTVISWLLTVPKAVPAVAAHARRLVSSIRRIVVPVDMHTNWERAVELACRLGEEQKAEILLTGVIEVPLTLSLNAPLDRAEKDARGVLERATAIVEHHKLAVRTQVERARQTGEGIARLAKDEEADLIVMATPRSRAHMPGFTSRTLETLLHRATCEVIIDAVPEETDKEPISFGPMA